MKLKQFRVQNYKKIRDTNWITVHDLTAFVGKNEAGKSSIFRGLSKLNPSDGERYDGQKEFPRRRFTDEFHAKDWPCASGRFVLTDGEKEELGEIHAALKATQTVVLTRTYSWKLQVEFEPSPPSNPVSRKEARKGLEEVVAQVRDLVAPDGKGEPATALKNAVVSHFASVVSALKGQAPEEHVPRPEADGWLNFVTGQAAEQWQRDLLSPAIGVMKGFADRARFEEELAQAKKVVSDALPRFLYFDKYDVIESAIHVPTFQSQVRSQPNGPKVRTTLCIFKHVGLDLDKMAGLGRHQPGQGGDDPNIRKQVDQRAILTRSASLAMTAKFSEWWEQRKHKFSYQVDGDYFRVWVSDDLDPSDIELDQRSYGMQYFFSFFTVFLVEAQDGYKNSVLLLDEPGLHLHGTAQAKIIKFFEKLSKDNQTLYSTHSPFLVDVGHLERARAVYEADDGTTLVSEDVWPRDRDALFPLQAALGYELSQTLFLSRRQLIVEGITDLWIIKAVNNALAFLGKTTLRADLVVVPSAGAPKIHSLAAMLIGHDVEVGALLDGDDTGRREGKKLVDTLLQKDEKRCVYFGDFHGANRKAEIEDMFPEAVYLAVAKEAYPNVDFTFDAAEGAIPNVIDKIEALFKRRGSGKFEKYKAAALLRDRIVKDPNEVPESVRQTFQKVFEEVNAFYSG